MNKIITRCFQKGGVSNACRFAKSALTAFALIAATSTANAAKVISINFADRQEWVIDENTKADDRSDLTGLNIGGGAWNNVALRDEDNPGDNDINDTSTGPVTLTRYWDGSGVKSNGTATVEWGSGNRWRNEYGPKWYMKGYLDDTGDGAWATVEGIPYEVYDVIVYCMSDGGKHFSPCSVNGIYYTWDSSKKETVAGYDSWGEAAGGKMQLGIHALKITGLSGKLSVRGGFPERGLRGGLAAIQIIESNGAATKPRNPDFTWGPSSDRKSKGWFEGWNDMVGTSNAQMIGPEGIDNAVVLNKDHWSAVSGISNMDGVTISAIINVDSINETENYSIIWSFGRFYMNGQSGLYLTKHGNGLYLHHLHNGQNDILDARPCCVASDIPNGYHLVSAVYSKNEKKMWLKVDGNTWSETSLPDDDYLLSDGGFQLRNAYGGSLSGKLVRTGGVAFDRIMAWESALSSEELDRLYAAYEQVLTTPIVPTYQSNLNNANRTIFVPDMTSDAALKATAGTVEIIKGDTVEVPSLDMTANVTLNVNGTLKIGADGSYPDTFNVNETGTLVLGTFRPTTVATVNFVNGGKLDVTVGDSDATEGRIDIDFTLSGLTSENVIVRHPNGVDVLESELKTETVTVEDVEVTRTYISYTAPATIPAAALSYGPNPTAVEGWFTAWDNDTAQSGQKVSSVGENRMIGPEGSDVLAVGATYNSTGYPFKADQTHINALTAFTVATIVNVDNVKTDGDHAGKYAIIWSIGRIKDNYGVMLTMKDGKFYLQNIADKTFGPVSQTLPYVVSDKAVGPGYHLVVASWDKDNKKLSVKVDDGEIVTATFQNAFNSFTGNTSFGLGMAVTIGPKLAGSVWADAPVFAAEGAAYDRVMLWESVLSDDVLTSLWQQYRPLTELPVVPSYQSDLDVNGATVYVPDMTTDAYHLSVTKGTMKIPAGTTVTVPSIRLGNSGDTDSVFGLDLDGTVTVTSVSTQAKVYDDQGTGGPNKRGVLLGHWKGTGTINVTGTLAATNAFIQTVQDPQDYLTLNINGGTVTGRGLFANNPTSKIVVSEGGVLEFATFPNNSQAIPLTASNGTLRAISSGTYTSGWTHPSAVTFDGETTGTTIDPNGKAIAFTGAIAGSGKIVVNDTSARKLGTVTFGDAESTFNGAVELQSGTLASGGALSGATALAFADGTTVDVSAGTFATAATFVTVDGTVTVDPGDRELTNGEKLIRFSGAAVTGSGKFVLPNGKRLAVSAGGVSNGGGFVLILR